MIQKTVDKSALLQSGICSSDPSIVLNAGNTIVNLPFWKNLTGDDEILSDSSAMTAGKITTGKDVACVHLRGRAWSANDLASLLAGDNAMNAIGNKASDYWAKQIQKVLIASLTGVFASSGMADSKLDISTNSGDAGILSANAMLDGMYLLGDAFDTLTGIMMHSAVMNKLAKLNLIDYLPDSEGRPSFPTYMGKRVIIDDALAPATITVDSASKKAYPIYFFGEGSVAFNEGYGIPQVETDRDKIAGDDYLITRRQFTMHPRGVAWTPASGEVTTVTPTNDNLADGQNWTLADDRKNVAITKLIARVD